MGGCSGPVVAWRLNGLCMVTPASVGFCGVDSVAIGALVYFGFRAWRAGFLLVFGVLSVFYVV